MLVLMVCLVFAVGSSQAAYLDEDFETYAVASYTNPDAYPDGDPADVGAVYFTAPSPTLLRIVDSTIDTPAVQPFGANSKFLNIYDSSTASYPVIRYAGDAVSGSGTFEMDFYLDDYYSDTGEPYYNIYLYDDVDRTTNAMYLRFSGTTLRYYDGSWHDVTNAYSLDTKHTLTVDFDTDTDTATVKIDGDAIFTNMDFRNAATEVALVQFSGGGSQQTSLSIDNLKIVPEPATFVLLGLGSLAMVFQKRR